MTTLTITRPDDWHVHLRDGEVLKDTVRDISRYNVPCADHAKHRPTSDQY